MFDFLQWTRFKRDVPPGTLLYAGEKKDFSPNVSGYAYDEQGMVELSIENTDDIEIQPGRTLFIHVQGVHKPNLIKEFGHAFQFPPLALEDVMNTGQRPKQVWLDDETGFIVVKNVSIEEEELHNEQVSLFWRDDFVIVFSENQTDMFDGILGRIRKGKGRIRKGGATYLVTAILDAIVDKHLSALGKLGEAAERLEADLLEKTTDDLLNQLYRIKRETILLRNTLVPVQDIFKKLLAEESETNEITLAYLRDVADHHTQAVEGTVALHDILKSMIDYQISLIGIRTNSVMQFLTIIATIFIPLTFIAGIYGMNFQYMPELQWRYGYFVCMAVMGVLGVSMFIYFIRKKML